MATATGRILIFSPFPRPFFFLSFYVSGVCLFFLFYIPALLFSPHLHICCVEALLFSLTGFHWVLEVFIELYRVLLGFRRFHRVLMGFTGFYLVLLDFTGFYRVLPSFTQFYPVLHSFTWFSTRWPTALHIFCSEVHLFSIDFIQSH